jgi:hypothetical protein
MKQANQVVKWVYYPFEVPLVDCKKNRVAISNSTQNLITIYENAVYFSLLISRETYQTQLTSINDQKHTFCYKNQVLLWSRHFKTTFWGCDSLLTNYILNSHSKLFLASNIVSLFFAWLCSRSWKRFASMKLLETEVLCVFARLSQKHVCWWWEWKQK